MPSGETSGSLHGASRQQLRPAAVRVDLPEAGVLAVRAGIDDPLSIPGLGGVLGILAVVGDLVRARAVGIGSPDLQVPAPVRAPEQGTAVRREGRIPVVRRVVRDAPHDAGAGGDRPQIEVPRPVGGEDHPFARRGEDRLAIVDGAVGDPARRTASVQGVFAEVLATAHAVEDDPPVREEVEGRAAAAHPEEGTMAVRADVLAEGPGGAHERYRPR